MDAEIMEMLTIDSDILEMLRVGQEFLDMQAREVREAEEKKLAGEEKIKKAAIERFYGYMKIEWPSLLPYADITLPFEDFNQWTGQIYLPIRIPGFSKIILRFRIKPDIKFMFASWGELKMMRPDEDEIGFWVEEYCQPGWANSYSESSENVSIALARARDEWLKWEKANAEWEDKKAELIAENERLLQQKIEEEYERDIHTAATAINISCTKDEREFLNALNTYLSLNKWEPF